VSESRAAPMQAIDFWGLCDEFSVMHAALLASGKAPQDIDDWADGNLNKQFPGYVPVRTALYNAIEAGKLKAVIVRVSTEYDEEEYQGPLDVKRTMIAVGDLDRFFKATLHQIHHVLSLMLTVTDIQRRDRALIALATLTGARVGALISLKVKHVDLVEGVLFQDARDVNTKFSKTFSTWFCPVGGEARAIVEAWVSCLRRDLHWGDSDPLFPTTLMTVGKDGAFVAAGLKRKHWTTSEPVRRIFRQAFQAAGLPYFHPHSFRDTLALHGEQVCATIEEFKAWSQNIGHDKVLTTLTSYGTVTSHRQAELIRGMEGRTAAAPAETVEARLARLERAMAPKAAGTE